MANPTGRIVWAARARGLGLARADDCLAKLAAA